MDVAVEPFPQPQLPNHPHQLFHGLVRRPRHPGAEKQPLDVVPPAKVDGQIHQLPQRERGPENVVAPPVDVVGAIVHAEIGEQNLEQRDAAAVFGEGVANAGRRAAAQLPLHRLPPAAGRGAGNVALGRVGQDFEFLGEVHGRFICGQILRTFINRGFPLEFRARGAKGRRDFALQNSGPKERDGMPGAVYGFLAGKGNSAPKDASEFCYSSSR